VIIPENTNYATVHAKLSCRTSLKVIH